MNKHLIASIVLVVFVMMAGFGLLVPMMGHMGNNVNCPFASNGTALCAAPLAHIKHWQDALVTILVETLLLGIALVFIKSLKLFPKLDPQYERHRLRTRAIIRPPLFQELYSQGILNRKAP